MSYKFEKLEVWQIALEYTDMLYTIGDTLPDNEKYNLRSQMVRTGTSIGINIAEGSTSQSDAEQARFLGYALRSLIETVACLHLIHRRDYLDDPDMLREAYRFSEKLFAKLQAFRASLSRTREPETEYTYDETVPF